MREIPLHDHAGLADDERRRLAALVASHRTLADVLAWARARAAAIADIVTQDEYTHDVVLPLDAERYLAYDTT